MFFYEHALLKSFNSAYLYVIPIVKTLCRLEFSFDLKETYKTYDCGRIGAVLPPQMVTKKPFMNVGHKE